MAELTGRRVKGNSGKATEHHLQERGHCKLDPFAFAKTLGALLSYRLLLRSRKSCQGNEYQAAILADAAFPKEGGRPGWRDGSRSGNSIPNKGPILAILQHPPSCAKGVSATSCLGGHTVRKASSREGNKRSLASGLCSTASVLARTGTQNTSR